MTKKLTRVGRVGHAAVSTGAVTHSRGIFPDVHFDNYADAYAEARRRRLDVSSGEAIITRIEDSPYGGYKVWSMPLEVYADLLSENFNTGLLVSGRLPKIPA